MSKSFQMSSNVERNNKKILPNLKRFFTWAQNLNLIKKTFLSFVQHLKKLLTKLSGSVFTLRNPKGCSFFLQNLFRCCTKPKKVFLIRFRFCAQEKNLFRFGRIFYCFFRHLSSFGSFLTSTERFWWVPEKPYFF